MSQVERAGHVEHGLHRHPGPRKYVFIGIVLAVITALEVGIYYINMPDWLLVTGLIFFGVMKFFLVVMWFMHLKFDSSLFKTIFAAGFFGAIILFLIVLVIFSAVGGPAPNVTTG